MPAPLESDPSLDSYSVLSFDGVSTIVVGTGGGGGGGGGGSGGEGDRTARRRRADGANVCVKRSATLTCDRTLSPAPGVTCATLTEDPAAAEVANSIPRS